jgi:hypothetical protein
MSSTLQYPGETAPGGFEPPAIEEPRRRSRRWFIGSLAGVGAVAAEELTLGAGGKVLSSILGRGGVVRNETGAGGNQGGAVLPNQARPNQWRPGQILTDVPAATVAEILGSGISAADLRPEARPADDPTILDRATWRTAGGYSFTITVGPRRVPSGAAGVADFDRLAQARQLAEEREDVWGDVTASVPGSQIAIASTLGGSMKVVGEQRQVSFEAVGRDINGGVVSPPHNDSWNTLAADLVQRGYVG